MVMTLNRADDQKKGLLKLEVIDQLLNQAQDPVMQAKLFNAKGYVLMQQDAFNEANEALQMALNLGHTVDSLKYKIMLNMGKLMRRRGMKEMALAYFHQVISEASHSLLASSVASIKGYTYLELADMKMESSLDAADTNAISSALEKGSYFFAQGADFKGAALVNMMKAKVAFKRGEKKKAAQHLEGAENFFNYIADSGIVAIECRGIKLRCSDDGAVFDDAELEGIFEGFLESAKNLAIFQVEFI